MTDSAAQIPPVLTFEGKLYDLNSLPEEVKELVRGMQVADAQLRMHEHLEGARRRPSINGDAAQRQAAGRHPMAD